jgi:Fe2+ transport system protein FeoA
MGITSGAVIDMVKVSPLGDPVEYRLRGYHLTLRRSEAETIEVELLEDSNQLEHPSSLPGSKQPLIRCRSGQQVEIVQIRGGRRLREKMESQGLFPGLVICIVQNDIAGPMIVSIGDSRVTVGKGMARHIMVKNPGNCPEETNP